MNKVEESISKTRMGSVLTCLLLRQNKIEGVSGAFFAAGRPKQTHLFWVLNFR